MTSTTLSDAERFWAGEFGAGYRERNTGAALVAARCALFSKVLGSCAPIHSAIELGANIGNNLKALRILLPHAELTGVEINAESARLLAAIPTINAVNASLLGFRLGSPADLSFTAGVLIHIPPADLPDAYAALYENARRYILVAEYYNPTPVEIPYRGHSGKLFKRDFAGELLDRYPNLRLRDYGFCYRRDPVFPMDDGTWFLLEKQG
ncbi:MAG: pseudaminic acid biosynthesis-associated methylase [Candidatus Sumerlaeia bacterium]|nr:pseudaminic acid biosynthesis-associated methylase [Candidatus Sumerlaeia bacterium]